MPRAVLPIITPKGPYPGTVAADDLDFTWTAGDPGNGHTIAATGRELLKVRNDDVGAQTFTIKGVEDPFKRTQDIGPYSVGAGKYAEFWLGSLIGYVQADKTIWIDVADANVFFAVSRIPS